MAIWSNYIWKVPKGNASVPCERVDTCPLVAGSRVAMAQAVRIQEQVQNQQRKLNQQKSELFGWQENLKKEKERLNQWQSSLQNRENKLAEDTAELQRKQRPVTSAEVEAALLKQKEQAAELQLRENALAARETWVESQLERLRADCERYKQERMLWEAALPARNKNASGVEEELDSVKKAFMSINAELKQTRESLLLLSDTASRSSRDGVALLCKLFRDMVFSREKQNVLYANRLGAILQSEFDAEPLEPYPGDLYDSTCHERLDTSAAGNKILCCRARGWRWKDEVIMRAVVETDERMDNQ